MKLSIIWKSKVNDSIKNLDWKKSIVTINNKPINQSSIFGTTENALIIIHFIKEDIRISMMGDVTVKSVYSTSWLPYLNGGDSTKTVVKMNPIPESRAILSNENMVDFEYWKPSKADIKLIENRIKQIIK